MLKTKKITREAHLQNFLLLTRGGLSAKSLLGNLIMQFRLHNLSIILFLNQSILKLLEILWKKLISEQLSRPRNLFLQQHIGRRDFTLLKSTETILWKTGRRSFGQMRLKSIDLGQMGTSLYEKKGVSHFLTESLFPLSSLEEEI